MRTSGILILSLAGFAFALWLARGGEPPQAAATMGASTARVSATAASATQRPRVAAIGVGGNGATATAPVAKLNPQSDAYKNRMDDQIPTHLYARAAQCYKGGLQRDQRLDLTYKIRVSSGAVSVGSVRVSESTLGDAQLERCIIGKVDGARWRDEQLPDLEEDGDLYMRVAGFRQYLANADDDDSPSAAMN